MHYYKFNIADYRKDTTHLSIVEHGIYRQLLDIYYLDEGPLPEKGKLMRLVCVRTADEERALDNVLSDFFEVTENGYENKRCNKVLEDIFSKSEKARQSAKARWKNKTNQNQEDNKENMRTHSERIANGMLPITHNPLPKEKIIGNSGAVPDCPHDEIISLYHELMPECPRVRVWTDKRQKSLRARWREEPKRQNLEWWRKYFSFARSCDFLVGKGSGDRPFYVDLEWLINSSNMVKVIEGKYQNAQ